MLKLKLQYFGHLMQTADSLQKTLMLGLQERGPLPGPESGLLSNTQKWIVQGDTVLPKQEILLVRVPGQRAFG